MSSSQQQLLRWERFKAVAGNQNSILLSVLIALAIVFTLAEPKFFSVATAGNILTDWGSVVLLAAGQTLVIISGGIDLSVGGILAISGVTSAWIMSVVLGFDITTSGPDAYPPLIIGALTAVGTVSVLASLDPLTHPIGVVVVVVSSDSSSLLVSPQLPSPL